MTAENVLDHGGLDDGRRAARASTTEARGPAIDVRGLVRRYGAVTALAHVSFTVPRGVVCGLVGPNGAGKTTLFSILATLDEGYEGAVTIAGANARKEPGRVRAKVGFVPDHAVVYESLRVEEYLAFFAAAYGLPRSAREGAVEDALVASGLQGVRDRPASGLSKGMTQRLCVARALLHEPEVLLLDEPASGLDPRARLELKQLLKALARRGKTVLVSSHILSELGDVCDRLLVLERGRVVADGAVAELWEKHAYAEGAERRLLLEVEGDLDRALACLEGAPSVLRVAQEGALFTCTYAGDRQAVAALVRTLVESGLDVVRVQPERADLEALFLTVTKGELQ